MIGDELWIHFLNFVLKSGPDAAGFDSLRRGICSALKHERWIYQLFYPYLLSSCSCRILVTFSIQLPVEETRMLIHYSKRWWPLMANERM